MEQPRFIIEEVTDPEAIERNRLRHEQFRRNSDWLQAHWSDILPQGYGKFLAVAGQEAFLGDTAEEARAKAEAAHPADQGVFCHYLRPGKGPRFYGSSLRMVVGR